jgi:hypothetical protein
MFVPVNIFAVGMLRGMVCLGLPPYRVTNNKEFSITICSMAEIFSNLEFLFLVFE